MAQVRARYVKNGLREEILGRVEAHRGAVTALAADEQGRWIISTGVDATLKVWNAGSGALVRTIEESDALIRTFNALLMIARAESGQARDGMTDFDAAEIARGVGELYEPLADDKGIALKVEAPAAAPVRGNRELVSQALANLVDNAIKYAGPSGRRLNGVPAEIVVKAANDGDRIALSVADRGERAPHPSVGRA